MVTQKNAARGARSAKWLARCGVASRRDIGLMIVGRRIRINGTVVDHPATFVTNSDAVSVDGKLIQGPEHTRLWRYYKPDGLVTTHRDPENRPTVFEKLPEGMPRVVSVGRLDLNSEGLLLLTNDGALARRLELPSNGWLRRYRVRVFGVVDERKLAGLAKGCVIEGVKYGSIEASLDSRKGDNAWLTVSLREGKNREIRRVMMDMNLHVSRLIRTSYGPFPLGELRPGELEEVPPRVMKAQLPRDTESGKARHD